jgi:hypothetical protein
MNAVTEKSHALLGPSGFHRWGYCPGSIELEKPFPNKGSKYARYGTACHELGDICLTKQEDAESWIGEVFHVEGEEIVVDMGMADLVNEYVSYVHTFLDRDAGDIILPEQQVPLTHMTGEKDAEGTSDTSASSCCRRPLAPVVIDLKTGSGVPVLAWDSKNPDMPRPVHFDAGTCDVNGQLAMYGSGALRKLGLLYDIEDVQLVIIQPPLKIVDDVVMTMDQLKAFEEQVSIAAGRTQVGNAELVPGDKQCKFCRAKSTCPALRDEVMSTMTSKHKSEFRNLDAEPDALPKTLAAEIVVPDDSAMLAAAMRSAALVETWLKGVRAEVERRLFDGIKVPGYKIVQGKKGNRAWGDEDKALEALKASRKKIDEITTRKIISPTVAEKLFKGDEKRWSKIAPLITQPEGGPSWRPRTIRAPNIRSSLRPRVSLPCR